MDRKLMPLVLLAAVSMAALAGAFKVAECEHTVDFDGEPDDDAWDDAESDDFGYAEVFACYKGSDVFFLVTLNDSTDDDEDDYVTILVDSDGSGQDDDDELENSDFGFRIDRDGDKMEYRGGDEASLVGWSAKKVSDSDYWSAEFKIPFTKLALASGDDTVMGFAVLVVDENGTDVKLPSGADDDDPSTWARLAPDEGMWGEPLAPTLDDGKAASDSNKPGEPGRYTFSVIYKQGGGGLPEDLVIRLDNQAHTLSKAAAACNVADGCRYTYSQDLAVGTHTFYFTAAYSGKSARFPTSGNLQLQISVANRKPSVDVTGPAGGSIVSGQVQVFGTASDPDGAADIASVEVRVDSGSWLWAAGTSSWSYIFDTLTVADGSHTVSARATDKAGVVSDLDSLSVVVKNEKEPEVTPDTDSDDDGMPDMWETTYGLDPKNPYDSGQDADSDGLTNLQEYAKGKDPTKSDNPQQSSGSGTPSGTGGQSMMTWALVGALVIAVAAIAFLIGRGGGRERPPRERPERPPPRDWTTPAQEERETVT